MSGARGHGEWAWRSATAALVFALGDSAFAFACNSYNEATVAAAASIDFLAGGARRR